MGEEAVAVLNQETLVIQFKLPYVVKEKSKWVVASCPILDVHSQGQTEKQAISNLKDALMGFLVSCFERGTLQQVLEDCNFELEKKTKKTVGKNVQLQQTVSIPLHLVADKTRALKGCPA